MARANQTETAYNEIKKRIITKRIAPGYPILETELSKELNMSRTPVREALKRLEAEGYFEMIPRKGAFLKTLTFDELILCYEPSEGLEGMLAYHLAERHAREGLSAGFFRDLDKLVEQMDAADQQSNQPLWVEYDTAFHARLLRECANPYLVECIQRLQVYFDSVSMMLIIVYADKDRASANREHREIVQAIRDGDPETARTVAQRQRRRIRNKMRMLTE